MKQLLILTMLLLFSMNCHHARVRLDNESGGTKGEVKTLQHKFWLGGFFPRKVEVDATQICPCFLVVSSSGCGYRGALWSR